MAYPFKTGQDVRYRAPDGREYLGYVHMCHHNGDVTFAVISEILPGDCWATDLPPFRGRVRAPAVECARMDRRTLNEQPPQSPPERSPRLGVWRAELAAWLFNLK